MTPRHLDDDEVEAIVSGRLAPAARSRAQAHIDSCNDCRQLVAEVARAGGGIPQDAKNPRVVVREGRVEERATSGLRRGRLVPGDTLADRYRLERLIGEGGMGSVWRAKDLVSMREFAVKILRTSGAEATRRFQREARVLASLRHPNMVSLHDVLILPDGAAPALVLELLEGQTLANRLASRAATAMPIREALDILLPVVRALRVAHTHGVVHRDLKPANVFLAQSASQPHLLVKVLDFGLAKITGASVDVASSGALTKTGQIVGTPHYMAPEQVLEGRSIDHRADLWSLGVMIYQCLTGVRPVDGTSLNAVLSAIVDAKIVAVERLVPSLPRDLSAVVGGLLTRAPDRRPPLREVEEVFRRALGHSSSVSGV